MITARQWVLAISGALAICAGAAHCFFDQPLQPSEPPYDRASASDNVPASSATRRPVSQRQHVPLPQSADEPIDALQQRLEPFALRGDLPAASALSRATMRCYNAASDVAVLQAQINAGIGFDQQRDATAKIDAINDFKRTYCDSLSPKQLSTLTRRAAKNAAKLGDVDAQLCVIEQRFLEPRDTELTPDERAHGEIYLADYQERALDRGDWRIVSLMMARTVSLGHGPIYARVGVSPIDPVTYFRSLQLLRLGAVGDYATSLDDQISAFVATTNPQLMAEDHGLSDQDIADAIAWAHAEFQSHFSDSPKLSQPPVACGDI